MRPPSLRLCLVCSAALALAIPTARPVPAEDARALPTCTPSVPIPPPEPPTRPEDFKGATPRNVPGAAAPLPPERPVELSAARPSAQPEPSPAGDTSAPKVETPPTPVVPIPLPPQRPADLSPQPPEQPRCIPALAAPLPPARPLELPQNPAAMPNAPLPPERPPGLLPAPEDDPPLPPGRPPELSGDAALELTIAPQDETECLRGLDGLGVSYTKAPPIVNGQCTVANPLRVSRLGNGIVIGSVETMVCRLAEGLARWTAEVRQIAETELGDALKGLTLGGTYVCRGQNHGAEAPLSEHAFANAVDVTGFVFGKRAPIAVGTLPDGSPDAAFLAAVRKKACAHFTTVLGPGADEQHADHLHLDERERKAGHRLCQ